MVTLEHFEFQGYDIANLTRKLSIIGALCAGEVHQDTLMPGNCMHIRIFLHRLDSHAQGCSGRGVACANRVGHLVIERSVVKILNAVLLGLRWRRQVNHDHLQDRVGGGQPLLHNALQERLSCEVLRNTREAWEWLSSATSSRFRHPSLDSTLDRPSEDAICGQYVLSSLDGVPL